MGLSASDDKKEWDVNASFAKTKPVTFTTDEGTWMNLDVSPDGSEIVFDMLGDLYTMPISGGKATRLIGDPSMELQPRYSPDGKWISFTSDRAGGDNIWIINRESGDLKQVSKESFRLLNNAVWTPDSQYLIARKHFTSTRSLGAGEMWMYHISGGSGLQLTKRKNDQQDAGEPEISPDGRYLWFSEDVSPGPIFQYNKNPNTQIYVIRQLDRETGDLRRLITGVGGSARPEVSPDGKNIAFVRRVRGKSALFLYNRETGGQDALFDGLNQDQQEAWAVFGIYPNFAWTHDGKALIFWAKGKIHRLEIASKKITPIPFEVEVDKTVHHSPRFKQEVSPDNFEAKMIRDAATSPDGKTLVFHAVGKLYQKSLPDGDPKRLTNGEDLWEYDPAFSPDGKQLVYTTWRDGERGAIEVLDLASGNSRTLTKRPGYYLTPRFSPDGKRIVYQRGSGNSVLGQLHSVDTGLFHIDSNGGEPVKFSESGREPRFNAAGDRIYFLTGFGLNKKYKSLNLTGGDERTHFDLKYVTSVVPSPDGNWVAFTELHNAYIAAFPKTGKSISLNKNTKAVPIKKVSRDVGTYVHWSASSDALHWLVGPNYHSRDLKDSFAFIDGAPDELPGLDEPGIEIGLNLKTDTPQGLIAFKGARIITMNGDEVIENGTILIENNRIKAVGSSNSVKIPRKAKIIDVTGETPVEHRGQVPPRSVVIPGTRPKRFPAGEFGVPCALIIGQRSESTDKKVSLEAALRDHDVAV